MPGTSAGKSLSALSALEALLALKALLAQKAGKAQKAPKAPKRKQTKKSTMFLTVEDYNSVCTEFEMEQISALTDDRLTAERAAMEQISSYTRHRYDMDRAFSAEGEERNPMLVQCAVNITLWLMIHRLPQSMGHERRECLYNDSIKWLRDVQNSKASPDLPTYTATDGTADAQNPIRYGSMPPNRYDY